MATHAETQVPTALVTGAAGSIGAAICSGLLQQGWRVIAVSRASAHFDQTLQSLYRRGSDRLRGEICDLSSGADIRGLAARISEPLTALVNNAVQSPPQRRLTGEGIELQFATNVLAYVRMTQCLLPQLKRGAPSRVVNVASYWAGDLDLSDLEFQRRRYDAELAYRQSKQANRMLTVAFARRLERLGITVNACHPGDVASKLTRDLGYGGHQTPEQGACTPVWLATSAEVASISGRYFVDCRARHCEFSGEDAAIESLYQLCLRYCET